MAWLNLKGLSFTAAVCSEANPGGAGSTVTDLESINLSRVLWVEVSRARQRVSLQLDPDRWLVLRFGRHEDFGDAAGQLEVLQ